MARHVAGRWLRENSAKEFRFTALGRGKKEVDIRLLVGFLRGWRDGKQRIASLEPIRDLGVKEFSGTDMIELWSSNCDALRKLATWMESRGFETNFIW